MGEKIKFEAAVCRPQPLVCGGEHLPVPSKVKVGQRYHVTLEPIESEPKQSKVKSIEVESVGEFELGESLVVEDNEYYIYRISYTHKRLYVRPLDNKLLPCPWCGKQPTISTSESGSWYIGCTRCAVSMGGFYNKSYAIFAWNDQYKERAV